jgi:hypothetical protein
VRPKRDADHSPPASAVVKKDRDYTFSSLKRLSGCIAGQLYFYWLFQTPFCQFHNLEIIKKNEWKQTRKETERRNEERNVQRNSVLVIYGVLKACISRKSFVGVALKFGKSRSCPTCVSGCFKLRKENLVESCVQTYNEHQNVNIFMQVPENSSKMIRSTSILKQLCWSYFRKSLIEILFVQVCSTKKQMAILRTVNSAVMTVNGVTGFKTTPP